MITTTNQVVPIQISDSDFFIRATMGSAPRMMMHRELIMNAIEASLDEVNGEKKRLIRYYADEFGRAAIINSGLGMDDKQLVSCTDLASSIHKTMGLTGRNNRGEGGKVSVLPFNTNGERMRSRKNGVIHEVFMFDSPIGWARQQVETAGPNGESFWTDVYQVSDEDMTQEEIARYETIPGDFTEVVLYGSNPDQQTAYDPYGDGSSSVRLSIAHEIFGRFYDLPATKAGIPLDVKFHGPSFRDGAAWREFVPLNRIVQAHPKEFENLEDRWVEIGGGVKIEYLKSKEAEKGRSPWNQFSLGKNGARIAVVWRSEMYELLEAEQWRREAVQYGLAGLANTTSVFVHLPDDAKVRDDRFRDRLLYDDGSHLSLRDFRDQIITGRPQWILDLLSQRTTAPESKDYQAELARIAALINQRPSTIPAQQPGLKLVYSGTGGGGKPSDNPDQKPSNGGNQKPNTGKRMAPASVMTPGPAQGVPNVVWTKDFLTYPDLKGRGAMFVEGTADLFINEEYDVYSPLKQAVIDGIANPLISDDETVTKLIDDRVKHHVTIKIGTAVLRALHRRGKPEWSQSDIKIALSREALSNVYDLCIDEVGDILRRIKTTDTFKLVSGVATAIELPAEAMSA